MKTTHIITKQLGLENVRLLGYMGTGGDFQMCPSDGGAGKINIGLDYDLFSSVQAILLHEVLEFLMAKGGMRSVPDPAWNVGHDAYVFHFNHPQFTELCQNAAYYVNQVTPALEEAWTKTKKN
jgi:hypothetical protein